MPNRKRDIHISLWLDEKENKSLAKLKNETKLSISNTIRKLITDGKINMPSFLSLQAVRELNAIGNNINQIARIANTLDMVMIDELREQIDKLKEVIENGNNENKTH